MELRDTLETLRDGFLHKSAEVELLQKKVDEQVRSRGSRPPGPGVRLTRLLLLSVVEAQSLGDVLEQSATKDGEISSLRAELARLSQRPETRAETRPRRGLLDNIREAVTSPRKSMATRSLRKTARTPQR